MFNFEEFEELLRVPVVLFLKKLKDSCWLFVFYVVFEENERNKLEGP